MSPSEFWGLSVAEWWRIYNAKNGSHVAKPHLCGLSEDECEELLDMFEE